MKYLLDGYNIIHKIDALRGRSLRNQRENLIHLLEVAQSGNSKFKDITVVFDGQVDVLAPRVISSVKVIFSKGSNADNKIKDIVEHSTFARDICVVSDDRQIIHYISSVGAKKIKVGEFLKTLSSSRVKKTKESFKLSAQEVNKINQELKDIWLAK